MRQFVDHVAERQFGDLHAVGRAVVRPVREAAIRTDSPSEVIDPACNSPVADVIPGNTQPGEAVLVLHDGLVHPDPQQPGLVGRDPILGDLRRYDHRRGSGTLRADAVTHLADIVASPAGVRGALVRDAGVRGKTRGPAAHRDSNRVGDAPEARREKLWSCGAGAQLAGRVLIAPTRDPAAVVHRAHTAVTHRDSHDVADSFDRNRLSPVGNGPAVDLTGDGRRARAIPTGGDRHHGRQPLHLRRREGVGVPGPSSVAPTGQAAVDVDGAVGRRPRVDFCDTFETRDLLRAAGGRTESVTELTEPPVTPTRDLSRTMDDARVVGSRRQRHGVGDPRHFLGEVAADDLAPPQLAGAAGAPARHCPVAVEHADVKLLMRMIPRADADHVLQACSAQPLADAVLTPARHGSAAPYGTRAATGGGDETVAASRRATHEHRAAHDRGPVGFGALDVRVTRARAG